MIPTISNLDLLKLASGDVLSLQVYRFVGDRPGKKTYIQSNLHGAEIIGNGVIQELIEFLLTLDAAQLQGEIWLVPVCNPLGVNQRSHFFSTGRFNSYDGKNWNRIFWDYEKQEQNPNLAEFAKSNLDSQPAAIRSSYLALIQQAWSKEERRINQPSSVTISRQYRYQLQSLCMDADYVIDIHSSSNQAINYTFGFKERAASAKYLLLEYGILMDKYAGEAFDEAFLKPWIALEKAFADLGRQIEFDLESWTLELGCGMTINPDSLAIGVKGIKNYLVYKQVLTLNQPVQTAEITLVQNSKINSYYAPTGGMIRFRLPLKTRVNQGDLLYQLLSFNKQGKLPETVDIVAETQGIVFDISTNECVNQGEYVMDILDC